MEVSQAIEHGGFRVMRGSGGWSREQRRYRNRAPERYRNSCSCEGKLERDRSSSAVPV